MTPKNSWPTLPDQALMSVLVTGSLDHNSTTSPMAILPMPFLASRSGPGQAAPRASMISAAVTVPSSATLRGLMSGLRSNTGGVVRCGGEAPRPHRRSASDRNRFRGGLCLALVGSGKIAESGDPTHQHLSHQPAGSHDLRIGELVSDLTSIADRLHDPRAAERGEGLRDRGLRHVEVLHEPPNLNRAGLSEVVDHLEATRTGQCLQKRGLQYVDAIRLAGHG